MSRAIGLLAMLAILALLSGSVMTSKPSPATSAPVDAPSCTTIIVELTPCAAFIKGDDNVPSSGCCSGIKNIGNVAKTPADRKAICGCLKQALSRVGTYDKNLIPQLPQQCGVAINLPAIDASTDCSKLVSHFPFAVFTNHIIRICVYSVI